MTIPPPTEEGRNGILFNLSFIHFYMFLYILHIFCIHFYIVHRNFIYLSVILENFEASYTLPAGEGRYSHSSPVQQGENGYTSPT